jgi:hypothetical protein
MADADVTAAVTRQERALLAQLTAGALVSAVAGSAVWAWGRHARRDDVAAFGRQSLAWAVVDAAIALWGRRGFARPPADIGQAYAKARRLRLLTAVNAGLDVGYVAGGAALTRYARTTGRRGDGAAIIVQGLFLLWLDTRHARRFHEIGRG